MSKVFRIGYYTVVVEDGQYKCDCTDWGKFHRCKHVFRVLFIERRRVLEEMDMVEYRIVAEFSSKSNSDKVHTVKRRLDTNQLTCDCPVWVFNRNGDRTCYHTMKVLADNLRESVGESKRKVNSPDDTDQMVERPRIIFLDN